MAGPASSLSSALRPSDITGAMAWWRDAGVDLDFADTPSDWLDQVAAPSPALASPAQAAAAPPALADPEPQVPLGGDRAAWPTELAAFGRWWLTEPTLDHGQTRDRVPPRGQVRAKLMVVVPQPEPGDSDVLLSGPEGRLLGAILAAMGLAADEIYLAAALPRHTPMVDWAAIAARGGGAVLAHHIALAAPERLIVFGSTVLPLLGHDPAHSAKSLPAFNHDGRTVPLLAARELGALLARPAWKAGFWRSWLDWTGTLSA